MSGRIAILTTLVGLTGACDDGLTPVPVGDSTGGVECIPNLDGVLEAAELPVSPGSGGVYLVAQDREVSLAGVDLGGGERFWDLSAPPTDDRRVVFAPRPIGEAWYAGRVPGATFAAPVDTAGTLEGAYSLDDQGLWLHALASVDATPSSGTTLLVYDAPASLVRFPLATGDAWSSQGHVEDGELFGLPYSGTDTYEVRVTDRGQVALPELGFTEVHRVDTRVTVEPAAGGVTVTRRQVSFLFECFGEVARAQSRDDEPEANFSTAAELRRLTF